MSCIKSSYCSFLPLVFTLSFALASCESKPEIEKLPEVSGKLTGHSDCKSTSRDSIFLVPDTLSCAEYVYISDLKRLKIKHINARFNCCPDSLYCVVKVSNDTIYIEEFENMNLCNCLCLYDLEIEIEGIAAKKYYISIIEPYLGTQTPLGFEVDFSAQTSGCQCVYRGGIPGE